MKKQLVIWLVLAVAGLVACSGRTTSSPIPPQHWKDSVIRIETHPDPPLPGMSEIVVIVTGPRGKPTGDLIVSLRGNEDAPWVQAIQDGFIGVYRRAVDIGEGDSAVVQVRLQRGAEQQVLRFPLKLVSG